MHKGPLDPPRRATARVDATAALALGLATFIWAGNFIIGRALRTTVPPISLAYWRWVIAGVVLVPIAGPALWAQRAALRQHAGTLLLLSLTGIAGYNTVLYEGLRHVTALDAALLLAITPLVIAALGAAVFGERLRAHHYAGIVLAIAGAVLILWSRGPSTIGGFGPQGGWVMLAVLLWAVFSLLLARVPRTVDRFATLLAIVLCGILMLTPLYIVEMTAGRAVLPSRETWSAFAFVGLAASVLAYWLWGRGVAAVGATSAGNYLNLIPLFSAVLGALFLNEPITTAHIGGGLLILSGLYASHV